MRAATVMAELRLARAQKHIHDFDSEWEVAHVNGPYELITEID
jgi:hypothetical protein